VARRRWVALDLPGASGGARHTLRSSVGRSVDGRVEIGIRIRDKDAAGWQQPKLDPARLVFAAAWSVEIYDLDCYAKDTRGEPAQTELEPALDLGANRLIDLYLSASYVDFHVSSPFKWTRTTSCEQELGHSFLAKNGQRLALTEGGRERLGLGRCSTPVCSLTHGQSMNDCSDCRVPSTHRSWPFLEES
jgi:hypothetical protein